MSAAGEIRASHQDRESTAEVLRQAYTAGRIDLAELQERTGAAYSARTWAQLRRLTADLPAGPDLSTGLSRACHQPPRAAGETTAGRGRPLTPMLVMAAIWLAIAAMAQAPQALLLPLVVLAIWAIYAAAWQAPGNTRDAPPGASPRPGAREEESSAGQPGPGSGQAPRVAGQAGHGSGQPGPAASASGHRRPVNRTGAQPACRTPRSRCRGRSPAQAHRPGRP